VRHPALAVLKALSRLPGARELGRVSLVRGVYDALFGLLVPRSAMVQGHRMWLDRNDTLELATREVYEPFETEIVLREVRRGEVVLDVGANIGYYTLLMARLTGPSGRVFAFEPDAANFQLLEKNVRQAAYAHVVTVNKAVSDRCGEARLYLHDANAGDHRVYDSNDGRPSVGIQAVAVDDFLAPQLCPVHFIKMDIQGAEMHALRGMQRLIRENAGIKLLTEFWPTGLTRSGADPRGFLRLITELGFVIYDVSANPAPARPVTPDELLAAYTVENDRYTNLFCVRVAPAGAARTAPAAT
jgi:FkbM family methyltransferase